MEENASLTANEAKSPIDDYTAIDGDEKSSLQGYPPPAYSPTSATVVPQTAEGSQAASVLTYQPQPYTWGSGEGRVGYRSEPSQASADRMFAISMCMCVVCCLCGSPLTLACFIPAILLSMKVS